MLFVHFCICDCINTDFWVQSRYGVLFWGIVVGGCWFRVGGLCGFSVGFFFNFIFL